MTLIGPRSGDIHHQLTPIIALVWLLVAVWDWLHSTVLWILQQRKMDPSGDNQISSNYASSHSAGREGAGKPGLRRGRVSGLCWILKLWTKFHGAGAFARSKIIPLNPPITGNVLWNLHECSFWSTVDWNTCWTASASTWCREVSCPTTSWTETAKHVA